MGFGQGFSREMVEGDFSSAGEKKIYRMGARLGFK